jgi:hypothetical protein
VPWPELAEAIDAEVDLRLVVTEPLLARPRIDAVRAAMLRALVERDIPPVAVLKSHVHPDATKLEPQRTEELLLLGEVVHPKRAASGALEEMDCRFATDCAPLVERQVGLDLTAETLDGDAFENSICEVAHARLKRPNDQAQRSQPETPGRLQQSRPNYLNRPPAQRGGGSLQRSG